MTLSLLVLQERVVAEETRMKLQRLVAMGPHIQEWAAGLHKYMEEVNSVVVENCIEQPVVVVNGGLEVGEATHTLLMVVVMEMVVVCDGREVVEARTQDMVAVMVVVAVEVVIQCKEVAVEAVLYKEVGKGEVGNGRGVEVAVMNKDKLEAVVNAQEAGVNAQEAGVSSTCKELVEVENSVEKAVEVNLVAAVVGSGHNREGRMVGEVMAVVEVEVEVVEASKLAVEVMVEAETEVVVVEVSTLVVEVMVAVAAVRKLVAVAVAEEVRVMAAAEAVERESQQEAKEQEFGV
ncbi:hypothetical protein ACLB2K_005212 [Fragaria x ananassa]